MPSSASDSEMMMRKPMQKRECIQFFLGGNKWRGTCTVGNDKRNGNVFSHSSSKLMGPWVRRPKAYFLLLVNSWLQKQKNQFHTLRVGLATRLQLRLRFSTPGCSAKLGLQVSYGPGSHNESWVRDWDRRNKLNFANTCATSPIRIHPSHYFLSTCLTRAAYTNPHGGRIR